VLSNHVSSKQLTELQIQIGLLQCSNLHYNLIKYKLITLSTLIAGE